MWWVPHNNGALNSQHNLSNLALTAGIALAVLGIVALGKGAVSRLHWATVKQCQEQAWPANQHAAHVEFCDAYLAGRAGINN